jgi:hypothetical protein
MLPVVKTLPGFLVLIAGPWKWRRRQSDHIPLGRRRRFWTETLPTAEHHARGLLTTGIHIDGNGTLGRGSVDPALEGPQTLG